MRSVLFFAVERGRECVGVLLPLDALGLLFLRESEQAHVMRSLLVTE